MTIACSKKIGPAFSRFEIVTCTRKGMTMANYPESTRICSLFANATRTGGTGRLGGHEPIVIIPGQRISLVKTSKTASNGSEVWSLLIDPLGADDVNRVYETRSTYDAGAGSSRHTQYAERDRDVPF
jgi:hypothetical protein